MTFKTTMIMGVVLVAFITIGMSGVAYGDFPLSNITFDKETKKIVSCKETSTNARITFPTLKVIFGATVDDEDSFKLGYNLPSTISKFVPGFGILNKAHCEPTHELDRIEISVQTEILGNENVYTCYNRGILNYSTVLAKPPVDSDRPLTDTVNGFPKTPGIVDVDCNRYAHEFKDNTRHELQLHAYYINTVTDAEKVYKFKNEIEFGD